VQRVRGNFWFTIYHGGGGQLTHSEQYSLIDDVKVAKQHIG